MSQSNTQIVPGVRKIVVLRANALGDFIFTLPALASIQEAYPEAAITLLGRDWHARFLQDRPGPIHKVTVIPEALRFKAPLDQEMSPTEDQEFFGVQAAQEYDLALQMYGGGRYSNPFVLRLAARLTAGLTTPDAAPLDRSVPYHYWQHEELRFLEVAGLVGARRDRLETRLAVTPSDLAEAEQVLPQDDRPLAVLHPGSGGVMRRWPPAKFARVGDALVEAGARVAVTGAGPTERELAARVLEEMCEPAADLSDQLTLNGLSGLLSRARVVVSNDSGPLHLARVVGARTVGIFWCGNLINAGTHFKTNHRQVLSWRLDCPVCGRNTITDPCSHSVSFVEEASLEEALEYALELFRKPVETPG